MSAFPRKGARSMSEAKRDDGNTEAPRVKENEARSGEAREESGTRRVGDARREHEETRRQREQELGTSWRSVVIGWLASLGALLILSGVVSGIVGAVFGAAGRQALLSGGKTALVGFPHYLASVDIFRRRDGYAGGRPSTHRPRGVTSTRHRGLHPPNSSVAYPLEAWPPGVHRS
jgi:hypothetical protein